MKKYFMTGTDEEVNMGDVIKQKTTERTATGISCSLEKITVSPDIISTLLELGVIEEREVKEETASNEELNGLETEKQCDTFMKLMIGELDDLVEAFEEIEKRYSALEEKMDTYTSLINNYTKELSRMISLIEKSDKTPKAAVKK